MSTNLERCQKEADEVTVIMLNNVTNVIERDGKLKDLEVRSDKLLDMSTNFAKTAVKVERKTRWNSTKCKIIVISAVVGVILLVVIITIIIMCL